MNVKTMRVVQTDSHGPCYLISLAVNLVNYVQIVRRNDVKELERVCAAIWPEYGIYYGDTHLRIWPRNEIKDQSFYVDVSGERGQP